MSRQGHIYSITSRLFIHLPSLYVLSRLVMDCRVVNQKSNRKTTNLHARTWLAIASSRNWRVAVNGLGKSYVVRYNVF
jgi:hypothetical protein